MAPETASDESRTRSGDFLSPKFSLGFGMGICCKAARNAMREMAKEFWGPTLMAGERRTLDELTAKTKYDKRAELFNLRWHFTTEPQ